MIFFRFLYVNTYAFLLIGLSIIVFIIPHDIFLIILKIICVLLLFASGIGIFSQWKSKNKKLKILIARNKKYIRLDTFEHLKETPCGLLVADAALYELRRTENYKDYSKASWKKIKKAVLRLNFK